MSNSMFVPLVSVTVITYNSAKTVLETLESIKAQTYQNIELIVSDDCSTDDTVEKCKRWLCDNSNRFVRVKLIESPVNTGTAANVNRAEAACQGEWVKGIAGDDILYNDCISNCINYIQHHEDVHFLFGRIAAFGSDNESCKIAEKKFDYSFFSLSSKEQLDRLQNIGNCIPAATFFYHRDSMLKLNVLNDERIPLLEDWPKWINLLKRGAKFSFVDVPLVRYRICTGVSTCGLSPLYFQSTRLFYFYYLFPEKHFDEEVHAIVDFEYNLMDEINSLKSELTRLRQSKAYLVGRIILFPIKAIKTSFNKMCKK